MKAKNAFLSLSHAKNLAPVLYFLLLLLLPTQLGKHFWPDYAVLSGFRVDYLSPTLYVTDLVLLTLFIISLPTFRLTKANLFSLLPYALFLVFLLLTLVEAFQPLASLYAIVKVLEMTFFAWYTARLLRHPRFLCVAVWITSLTVIGESLLVLLQLQAKGSLGGLWYYVGERMITSLTPGAATTVLNGEVFLRPYGTFSHPNVLAGFLLISLTFLFGELHTFTRYQKLYGSFVLVLGTLSLLATLSRIPILLWGLFLFVSYANALRMYLIRHHTDFLPHRLLSVRGGVGAIGLVSLLMLLLPYLSRLLQRFLNTRVGEESFIVRGDLNVIALKLIQEHPVLGVGLGNFLFSSILLKSAATPLFLAVQPVHNIFLLAFAETGVLGLFLLVWFLGRTFLITSPQGKLLLGLVFLTGLFDHYWLTLQQGQLLFSFVVGYAWAVSYAVKKFV